MKPLALLILILFVGCSTSKRGDLLGDPFTFIGVPRVLSEETFQDLDGLERGLLVDVVRVTAGSLSERQIEFPIPADQPSPLKIGVKYSIIAGYGQHGRVILDYHEVK
jgi:hypothetical protein